MATSDQAETPARDAGGSARSRQAARGISSPGPDNNAPLAIFMNRDRIKHAIAAQTLNAFARHQIEAGLMIGATQRPAVSREHRRAAVVEWQELMRAGVYVGDEMLAAARQKNWQPIDVDAEDATRRNG